MMYTYTDAGASLNGVLHGDHVLQLYYRDRHFSYFFPSRKTAFTKKNKNGQSRVQYTHLCVHMLHNAAASLFAKIRGSILYNRTICSWIFVTLYFYTYTKSISFLTYVPGHTFMPVVVSNAFQ